MYSLDCLDFADKYEESTIYHNMIKDFISLDEVVIAEKIVNNQDRYSHWLVNEAYSILEQSGEYKTLNTYIARSICSGKMLAKHQAFDVNEAEEYFTMYISEAALDMEEGWDGYMINIVVNGEEIEVEE